MPLVALDASVLVAGVLTWHEHHETSRRQLAALGRARRGPCVPIHSLLESYAVLTRLPSPHRLRPADAWELLHESFGGWAPAPMSEDVWSFLDEAARRETAGGAIYDAAILESALLAGAGVLMTWNVAHFERLNRGRIEIRRPAQAD